MPVFRRFLSFAFFALVCAVSAPIAMATPGDPDPSFDGDGLFQRHFDKSSRASSLLIQPDGKIVVAGWTLQPNDENRMQIMRLLPNGTPDPAFSGDGVSEAAVPGEHAMIGGIARQPDGKVVAIGSIGPQGGPYEWGFARFREDGALDAPFGGGIFSRTVDSLTGRAGSIVIQPSSGRLIAGGFVDDSGDDSALLAVTSTGSAILDNSWGTDGDLGSLIFPISASFEDSVVALAQQPDEKILVVSTLEGSSFETAALWRVTADGQYDASYSIKSPLGPDGFSVYGATLQSDGKLVIVGEAGAGTGRYGVVLRMTAAGAPDTTFGDNGSVSVPLPGGGFLYAAAQQADGKLVLSGGMSDPADSAFVRLMPNGALDGSFGAAGVVRAPLSQAEGDFTGDTAIQSDGQIVSTGVIQLSSNVSDFAVARRLASDPPVVPLIPFSRITSPSRASHKRKKFKRFAGTAGPTGQVSKVELAVRRVNSSQLRKKRCLWLRSNRAKFSKLRSTARKKCTRMKWLKARGTANWSYALKKTLPAGRYEVYVRATLKDGQTQKTFTFTQGNFRALRLSN